VLGFFLLFPLLGYTLVDNQNHKTIGISQIVEHPALDAVRLGLIASLKEHGYIPDQNLTIRYENAQGNLVTSTQIAIKLLSAPLNIIIGISTPSAQTLFFAAKRSKNQVPIVFTAVNDPKAAKLEPGSPPYPITGITDSPNVAALLKLMKKMMPNLKTVGLLYNPSEPNSVSTIHEFKTILNLHGIQTRELTVNSTTDIPQAMQSIIGKVDALYFPQDNTVVSAIETVVNIADQGGTPSKVLPLFCSDPLLVERGVLAAVGYDYTEVGRETGEMVVKLLQGADIKDLKVHNPLDVKTVINKALADRLGLKADH